MAGMDATADDQHGCDAGRAVDEELTARGFAEDLFGLARAGLIRLDSDNCGQLRACILDEDF
jgi:hypothetical protein